MMSVTLTVKNNIGVILFDLADSKVNLLTFDVLEKFGELLDEIHANSDLKALIIQSENGIEYESVENGKKVSWLKMIDASTDKQKVRKILPEN